MLFFFFTGLQAPNKFLKSFLERTLQFDANYSELHNSNLGSLLVNALQVICTKV